MKVCCNNCGFVGDESELKKVIATDTLDGEYYREYDPTEQINESFEEVINGCPHCLTDEFLMDM